jgi:hypothetical protein
MQEAYPENVLLQCRLFELLNPSPILVGQGSRNPEGYCKNGEDKGISLNCYPPNKRDPETGKCIHINEMKNYEKN